MTTTVEFFPRETRAAASEPPRTLGPLLVATDGTEESDVAFRIGELLGTHLHADVHVLAVLEPLPMLSDEMELPTWVPEFRAARRDELSRRVEAQLASVAGSKNGWQLEVREGSPAPVIAAMARQLGAQLVIVGLGRHGFADRLFGDETTLQLLRLCDVPVLALPPEATALPSRAVIATDFTAASVRAARQALRLLRADATVYLVHVLPIFMTPASVWDALRPGLQEQLDEMKLLIGAPATMTVETVTLHGAPPRELLIFADTAKADVIVAGAHGRGFLSRLILGSVATQLVRRSPVAVLVAPMPVQALRAEDEAGVRETHEVSPRPEDWPRLLEELTQRNASRDCVIEVDDPELGAQAQAFDYPFLGAAYDHHDRRVDIMLGEMTGERRHLTRSIGDVSAIDVLTDERGRDRMLRIAHGRGQTLVSFVPRRRGERTRGS